MCGGCAADERGGAVRMEVEAEGGVQGQQVEGEREK